MKQDKMKIQTFNHVDYLWDEAAAAALGDDQIALFLWCIILVSQV